MERRPGVRTVVLTLGFVLLARDAVSQAATVDSGPPTDSTPAVVEPTPWKVMAAALSCARDRALAAGFTVEGSTAGRGLVLWHPHIRSMDALEYDIVEVEARPGRVGQARLLTVEAYEAVGRPMISTSSDRSRPPTRDAIRLRDQIRRECSGAATE